MKPKRQHQILCGGCRKPLVRGTSCHIVDLVGETYAERVGLQCENPLCSYNTRVIEEIREDRSSWWSRVARWFRVGKAEAQRV